MMKTKFGRVLGQMGSLLLIAVLMFVNTMPVRATEIQTDPFVVVDKYEVTKEKIVPGEEFTLTITLKNYHSTKTATGVLIDITNPQGVAPVYGTVSQLYIGDIGPGQSKNVEIDYNSWTTITSDTVDFNVTVLSDTNTNYITLRVPAGADSPFSILNVDMPTEVIANEYSTVSVTFKVFGENNVKDVVLRMESNGEMIANSMIGILTPGTSKTQQLLLRLDEVGQHVIDMGLEYIDESGQKKIVSVATDVINVVEKSISNSDVQENPNTTDNTTDQMFLLGVGGMLILVVFLVIVVALKKKK